VLTSASIEYEIHAPGGASRKIRRAVFDLIGPAARAATPVAAPTLDEKALLTRSLALMMETDILPVVSRFAPEYVTHLGAQSVLANRALLTAAMRGELRNDFAGAQDVASRLVPAPTPLYGLALARFEGSRFDGRTYIDRPNILTRHTYVAPALAGFTLVVATDIVANDIGVDLLVEDPFAVRLEQGVLDTNAEALVGSARPDGSNAGWAYAGPGSWTTIRAADDPALAALGLSDDVRRRIADDVAAGFIVVAPTSPVAVGSEAFSGWWRIDPASGQAVGLGGNGWGQSMTEFLITVGWAFATAYMFQYLLCQMMSAGEGPMARGCNPSTGGQRPAVADLFVTPVHAAGGDCAKSALFAGLLGGLLGAALGYGALAKSGGGKGGKADPFGKTQPDLGKTQADVGKTLDQSPYAPTQPGPGGAGTLGGSGPKGWGSPSPAGGGGAPNRPLNWGEKTTADYLKNYKPLPQKPVDISQYPPDVQKEIAAWNQWQQAKGTAGEQAAFEKWHQALRESLKAGNPNDPYFKDPVPPGPYPFGPKGAPQPGQGPGPSGATPPTGPGGTQIMKGPGQTQKIPQANCPGPACPPTAQQKTLTGLGGVANALGQKTGG
jgi:hypothetical protein